MGKTGKKNIFFLITVLITALFTISVILFINRGFIIAKVVEKTFLKAGKPLKFGAYTVIIDRVEGNKLFGIKMSEHNRKLEATNGDYKYLPEQNSIEINLIDGIVEDSGAENLYPKNKLTFKKYHMVFKIK
ncbi:MAG: hypothetical protein ABSE81_06155 [Candidatus Omnitrophota bacterium]|jgi:hypothetical protein